MAAAAAAVATEAAMSMFTFLSPPQHSVSPSRADFRTNPAQDSTAAPPLLSLYSLVSNPALQALFLSPAW